MNWLFGRGDDRPVDEEPAPPERESIDLDRAEETSVERLGGFNPNSFIDDGRPQH